MFNIIRRKPMYYPLYPFHPYFRPFQRQAMNINVHCEGIEPTPIKEAEYERLHTSKVGENVGDSESFEIAPDLKIVMTRAAINATQVDLLNTSDSMTVDFLMYSADASPMSDGVSALGKDEKIPLGSGYSVHTNYVYNLNLRINKADVYHVTFIFDVFNNIFITSVKRKNKG